MERVWRKHGLQVPQRPKKRKIKTGRSVPCQAQRPDQVWSYDFQEDALLSGRKVRLLNILDELGFYWGHARVAIRDGRRFPDQPGSSCGPLSAVRGAGRS